MPERHSRRTFLTAAGTGLATALAGCGGNAPDETEAATDSPTDADTETATETPEGEKTETGGTLRLASAGSIQTLDPASAKAAGSGYNQYQESLMTFEDGDLPVAANLATDYEVSEDGRTYTFDLKEGVQFHDSDQLDEAQQELTAQDVVYSWERVAQSENSRNKVDIIGETFAIEHDGDTDEAVENYEPWSMELEAVDDYTLRFTMESAFHGVVSQVASGTFGVVPEGAVGDVTEYDGIWDYGEFFSTDGDGPLFVGTGPFEVDTWSKGDELELSAFEEYHGEGPYIDGIQYTALSSAEARYRRATNGNLDIFEVPTSQFEADAVSIDRDRGRYQVGTYEMDNGETVNYGVSTTLRTEYFYFNTDRVERPVRQALAYLVDQDSIAEDIYKGVNAPAYTLVPNVVFPHEEGEEAVEVQEKFVNEGFRANEVPEDVGVDGYPYGREMRAEEARELMEEAGYSEDDPYSLTLTVYSDAGFTNASAWQTVAQRIRDKAVTAHIDISIEQANLGTILSGAIDGELDMFALGDGMEWPESDNFHRYFHPADVPEAMLSRWTYEDESEWTPFMKRADEAWQHYLEHKGPGAENQTERNESYVTIEQCNWASVQALPTVYTVRQRWWTEDVNVRMAGPMGRQTYNMLTLDRED